MLLYICDYINEHGLSSFSRPHSFDFLQLESETEQERKRRQTVRQNVSNS